MVEWIIKNFSSEKIHPICFLVLEQFLYRNPINRSLMIRKSGFSHSQVHKVFNSLEEYGLIRNIHCKDNLRKKMYELTDSGTKVAKLFVRFKNALRDAVNGEKKTNS